MAESSLLQSFYDYVEAKYIIDETSDFTMKYLYVPFLASFLYVVLTFSGRHFMQNRFALKLQLPLILWNGFLASYSIVAFVIMAPPLYRDVQANGFTYSMCNSLCRNSPWLSFWALVFTLSKLVELGDTFFVVVRKAPLHFLHWYHHITVLCYTWYALASQNNAGHWFCAVNLAVHSVMYTYYMLKSMKFYIPSRVALLITLMQLAQFILGLIIVINGSYRYINNLDCGMEQAHLTAGFIMYGSYFILFLNFFYNRYVRAKPNKKAD